LQQLVEQLPEADHPVAGRYRLIPPPVRFDSGGDNASPAPAPLIGQHTVEVLEEVGLSTNEIAELIGTEAAIADEMPVASRPFRAELAAFTDGHQDTERNDKVT
jgi:hypothetical protein